MSSGRSFSERVPAAPGRRGSRAAGWAVLACLALLAGPRPGLSQALPPPPENTEDVAVPAPKAPVVRVLTCPRCGYRCETGWHYCVSCGWDLTRLVGDAEEARLQAIARAAVRVTVAGRPNRHATAFPFGGPGLMLTNARVLNLADGASVTLMTYNNREYPAAIVGLDLPSGVGLLKAEIPGLPAVEIAPAAPAPPEPAWAVCYPVEFEGDVVQYLPVSLHRGQLTASGQTGAFLVSFENLLRTDHAIESGCSGGPLVDSRGRVAGMILGSPEDGLTYATPLEGLQSIATTLSRNEHPARSFFGMGLVAPDDRRRQKFAIESRDPQPIVAYLIPGSPAAQAGVRAGDRLLAVGGQKVASVWEAGKRLLAGPGGSPGVELTLAGGGGERRVTVKPTQRPERILLDPVDEIQESLEATLAEVKDGSGAPPGLLITDVVRGGRGEKSRYRKGDVIVSVEGKSVKSFQAFADVIHGKFKDVFAEGAGSGKTRPSSYFVTLEVRTEEQEKVTRRYVNYFPDFLAPPVY